MVNLEVVFLGTSAAMPAEGRSLSSLVVNRNGTLLIFDAGEGMQYNFIRTRLGFNKKTMLFVTHMHSDHKNPNRGGAFPGLTDRCRIYLPSLQQYYNVCSLL